MPLAGFGSSLSEVLVISAYFLHGCRFHVCPRVPKPAPEMSTRGFRVGTNLERQWPSLYGLRWLLGLGLLLRLQGRPLHGFYLPRLIAVNFCQAEREIAFCQVRIGGRE